MHKERYPAIIVLAGSAAGIHALFEELKREVQDVFRGLTCVFVDPDDPDIDACSIPRHVDIAVIKRADVTPSAFGPGHVPPLYLFINRSDHEQAMKAYRRCRATEWRHRLINPDFLPEVQLNAIITYIRSERFVAHSEFAA